MKGAGLLGVMDGWVWWMVGCGGWRDKAANFF